MKGEKQNKRLSFLQELFAYGVGNIVTAFFNGFPACVSLSRCAVIEGTGGKTQVRQRKRSDLLTISFPRIELDRRYHSVDRCANRYSRRRSIISYVTQCLFSSHYRHRDEEHAATNQTIATALACE